MRLSMVVAADPAGTIGREGGLPWHLPEDLKRFRRLTTGHVVVVGRITHESIVERLGRPLPERFSVVVSRQPRPPEESVVYQPDVPAALVLAGSVARFAGQDEVFVIGGAEIYRLALPQVQQVHLTRVAQEVEGDRALPAGWLDPFDLVEAEPRDGFTFETYVRRS
jgi:dihydrofolate reductase